MTNEKLKTENMGYGNCYGICCKISMIVNEHIKNTDLESSLLDIKRALKCQTYIAKVKDKDIIVKIQ